MNSKQPNHIKWNTKYVWWTWKDKNTRDTKCSPFENTLQWLHKRGRKLRKMRSFLIWTQHCTCNRGRQSSGHWRSNPDTRADALAIRCENQRYKRKSSKQDPSKSHNNVKTIFRTRALICDLLLQRTFETVRHQPQKKNHVNNLVHMKSKILKEEVVIKPYRAFLNWLLHQTFCWKILEPDSTKKYGTSSQADHTKRSALDTR